MHLNRARGQISRPPKNALRKKETELQKNRLRNIGQKKKRER